MKRIDLKKHATDILLYASIGVFLFGAGYKFAEWNLKKNARQQFNYTIFNADNKTANAQNVDFSLFWETWEKIEQKYIDDEKIDPQNMFYGSIKGMVASLGDPYTFFLTPEENQQSKDDLGGKFQGIGAQLGLKENRITVIAPLKDSPAEQAGIRTGDFITEVDGESTEGWTLYQAVNKIRGEAGTAVNLTVERNGEDQEIQIIRNEIKVPSVELSYENNNGSTIAHLKLNQFGETTNDEWNRAVNEIKTRYEQGTVKGMIVDVRDNPGGYLDGAVYIASEFLDQGQKVVTQEATESRTKIYTVNRQGKLPDIPLVVLINEGSASASEILAGALRDYDRATLIGMKSFGKGSVQEAIDLENGAGLHVTIAKWILPNGDWINGKGIEPEIEVDNEIEEGNTLTRETDQQLINAIELLAQ